MLSNIKIKHRLWIPIGVLVAVIAFTAVSYLLLRGEIEKSNAVIGQLKIYAEKANTAKVSLLKFAAGEVSFDQTRPTLQALQPIPEQLSQNVSEAMLDTMLNNVQRIESLQTEADSLASQVLRLTNTSIQESNSFMPYIKHKLLTERDAANTLEIDTIVGANENTNNNFRIQTLFLQMISNPETYPRVAQYLDTSIANVKKDVEALKGTQFEDSPKKALEVNYTVVQLVKQYRDNQTLLVELRDTVLADFERISDDIFQQANTSSETMLFQISSMMTVLLVVLLIAIGLIACLNIATAKNVLGQIKTVTEKAAELAKFEGDLTQKLPVKGRDEISVMSSAFNDFIERVREIVVDIKTLATDTGEVSAQLEQMNSDVENNITAQQMETEMVATAVNQMSAAIQEISKNANFTAESANDALTKSADGQEMTEQAKDEVNKMLVRLNASVVLMSELDEVSGEIGSIVDVIGTIAEQTNLLALNAAIEAARAGEQGRGFSVVADEVRSLATKTQDSLDRILKMINALQTSTAKAVDNIQQTQHSSTTVDDSAKTSTQALLSIKDGVQLISDSSIQIAAAVEEQSTVTESISQSVINIKDLNFETQNKSAETLVIAREMRGKAANLSSLVGTFRT